MQRLEAKEPLPENSGVFELGDGRCGAISLFRSTVRSCAQSSKAFLNNEISL